MFAILTFSCHHDNKAYNCKSLTVVSEISDGSKYADYHAEASHCLLLSFATLLRCTFYHPHQS